MRLVISSAFAPVAMRGERRDDPTFEDFICDLTLFQGLSSPTISFPTPSGQQFRDIFRSTSTERTPARLAGGSRIWRDPYREGQTLPGRRTNSHDSGFRNAMLRETNDFRAADTCSRSSNSDEVLNNSLDRRANSGRFQVRKERCCSKPLQANPLRNRGAKLQPKLRKGEK
jgi:hypothetical protein